MLSYKNNVNNYYQLRASKCKILGKCDLAAAVYSSWLHLWIVVNKHNKCAWILWTTMQQQLCSLREIFALYIHYSKQPLLCKYENWPNHFQVPCYELAWAEESLAMFSTILHYITTVYT